MAAFDKVKSGFPGVDNILDFIRMGDNVVWQVNDIDEFRFFALPFVKQARQDGRSITYVRFAQHRPILEDTDGVDVVVFNPDEGFEAFTVAIHEEITRKGRDAFYVFDCLSELQSVWYTDLMMGNFFRVTCPYLFELDTVAYFPIMRGRRHRPHPRDDAAPTGCVLQREVDLPASIEGVGAQLGDDVYAPRLSQEHWGIPADRQRREHQPLLPDDPGNPCEKSGSEYRQLRSFFQHGQGCFSGEDVHAGYGDADY